MRKFMWVATAVLMMFAGDAAAKISARALVQTKKVSVGQQFMFSVTIEGTHAARVKSLDLPDGITQLHSSQQSSTSIINGAKSISLDISYILRADVEGKFRLGPATIIAGGKQYRTNTVSIEVTAKKASASTGKPRTVQEYAEENLRIKLQTSKKEYYLGEPIVVSGAFETNLNQNQLRQLSLSYQLDLRQDIFIKKHSEQNQIREIYYALKPGTYRIGPIRLQGSMSVQSGRSRSRFNNHFGGFDDFFGRREPFNIYSNTIDLIIKPLPVDGRPDNFSDAVGEFTFEAKLLRDKTRVGEGLEIEITVDGQGNLQSMKPPLFKADQNFDFYPPEEVSSSDKPLGGRKIFRLKAVPKKEDLVELPEITFSYFSPDKGEYVTLRKGPFPIEVLASDALLADGDNRARPELVAVDRPRTDIFGARRFVSDIQTPAAVYFKTPLVVGLQLAPLVLILGSVFYIRYQRRLSEDTAFFRATRAYRRAARQLSVV